MATVMCSVNPFVFSPFRENITLLMLPGGGALFTGVTMRKEKIGLILL